MDSTINNSKHPKLVIIGAGFGGIALAKKLRNEPFDVLLIEKGRMKSVLNSLRVLKKSGPCRARTYDQWIMSPLL